jgi:hypothetical protein
VEVRSSEDMDSGNEKANDFVKRMKKGANE